MIGSHVSSFGSYPVHPIQYNNSPIAAFGCLADLLFRWAPIFSSRIRPDLLHLGCFRFRQRLYRRIDPVSLALQLVVPGLLAPCLGCCLRLRWALVLDLVEYPRYLVHRSSALVPVQSNV